MRHNSIVIDTTHGVIYFPHMTMPAKNVAIETIVKPQHILIDDNTTIPQMSTKTTTAFVDHPSQWYTLGTVTPVGKFAEAASLVILHSISAKIDK